MQPNFIRKRLLTLACIFTGVFFVIEILTHDYYPYVFVTEVHSWYPIPIPIMSVSSSLDWILYHLSGVLIFVSLKSHLDFVERDFYDLHIDLLN